VKIRVDLMVKKKKEEIVKICPIMTSGTLQGYRPQTDPFKPTVKVDAIKCYKEQCGMWNEEKKRCGRII